MSDTFQFVRSICGLIKIPFNYLTMALTTSRPADLWTDFLRSLEFSPHRKYYRIASNAVIRELQNERFKMRTIFRHTHTHTILIRFGIKLCKCLPDCQTHRCCKRMILDRVQTIRPLHVQAMTKWIPEKWKWFVFWCLRSRKSILNVS